LNVPIYEQSMNVRDMILVWWRTTWRILASWAMHTSGLAAMKIAEIGNLWYKFTPKGYIPLSDFYKIWCGGGSPRTPQSCKILPLWWL